jgi:hypothetical protein
MRREINEASQGKRPLGRPKVGKKDNIKMDYRKIRRRFLDEDRGSSRF